MERIGSIYKANSIYHFSHLPLCYVYLTSLKIYWKSYTVS